MILQMEKIVLTANRLCCTATLGRSRNVIFTSEPGRSAVLAFLGYVLSGAFSRNPGLILVWRRVDGSRGVLTRSQYRGSDNFPSAAGALDRDAECSEDRFAL